MSRADYPVAYRVLALKDGLVVKLQFAHGERDELVLTNDEALGFAGAILFTLYRREETSDTIGAGLPDAPGPEPKKACVGFRWIGQAFSCCDRCSLPYWEHTHDERLRGGPNLGLGDDNPFELVPITPEMAEACRKKWGPR